MIKIDINISILFKEYPFIERFEQAARQGFEAVEFYWNTTHDPEKIVREVSRNELKVAAFNLDAGNLAEGERGLLNDPARDARMRENVAIAVELAEKIGCKKLTALAGNLRPGEDRETQMHRIRENFRWICDEAANAGMTVMTEAVNAFDNKDYPLTNTADTIAFLESTGAANAAYLYDIFHMQRMEGNIIETLERHIGRIGHIQIADVPGRHHPGTGEINYRNVFAAVEKSGYQGSVGLEYISVGTTEEDLAWLPSEHRGGIDPASFRI
jgi:hydroxypyruvate isomerase